ncbi:hypothetical protein BJ322DRAFT_1019419 [Thelephora terrestris]|uniref:Uncharacterized protein n=1 Tax=Thelephora terrestris TaxID=56493 RepID=A0A9P6L8J7_9AGAM|nr:hypothetical protein BJ322DRAFT_1019419 [Thelephora terrestris]
MDESVLTLFFEDETSVLVSDEVKVQVRGDLLAYWIDMANDGERLVAYNCLGLKRREDYRQTMENKYPWLRLCEGHWKVRQIWINYWKKDRAPKPTGSKSKGKTPIEIFSDAEIPTVSKAQEAAIEIMSDTEDPSPASKKKKVSSPIVISSDTDGSSPGPQNTKGKAVVKILPDVSSIGSKRGRNTIDASDPGSSPRSPKKHKVNAVATAGFHPAKAQPKKKPPVKMGRVDPFAKVKVTATVSEAKNSTKTPIASGSGTVHISKMAKNLFLHRKVFFLDSDALTPPPPPITDSAMASVVRSTAHAQNMPVASGSGTIRSSPPRSPTPEQTLCTTSRNVLDAVNTSIAGPFTQIRAMLEYFPSSPTHESSSPAPAGPSPPKITPIITTLTPNANGNNNQDTDSATESDTPEVSKPRKKKCGKKGHFPWRKLWFEEWQKKTGGTDYKFGRYLKHQSQGKRLFCAFFEAFP